MLLPPSLPLTWLSVCACLPPPPRDFSHPCTLALLGLASRLQAPELRRLHAMYNTLLQVRGHTHTHGTAGWLVG